MKKASNIIYLIVLGLILTGCPGKRGSDTVSDLTGPTKQVTPAPEVNPPPPPSPVPEPLVVCNFKKRNFRSGGFTCVDTCQLRIGNECIDQCPYILHEEIYKFDSGGQSCLLRDQNPIITGPIIPGSLEAQCVEAYGRPGGMSGLRKAFERLGYCP